ncbi:MAG: D-glycerate dehydrogenase [Rhodoblastus sp.]
MNYGGLMPLPFDTASRTGRDGQGMPQKKPLVVVTRKLPEVVEARMRELFDVRLNAADAPMTHAELAEAMRTADVLVPTVTDRIDAGLVAQAGEQMKLIANFGNGVDNIDVTSALRRGITVTNTPGVLTDDTADMTMALIMAVARRIVEGAQTIPSGDWAGWSPTWMLGHRITGKKLGIVGMGRIGQAVALRAAAFGLRGALSQPPPRGAGDRGQARRDLLGIARPDAGAHGHRVRPLPAHAGDLPSAVRAPPEISAGPHAIVVNTARGEIIDENALIRMLEANELAGAGLDVFEHEPAVSPKLVKLAKAGKVTLLPHMGSATIEGRIDMGEKVIVNVKTFMDGHRPPDRVLPSML